MDGGAFNILAFGIALLVTGLLVIGTSKSAKVNAVLVLIKVAALTAFVIIALPAAKAFCADTFFMCAGNMIQLHGGIGFTWEHDAHLFFKRARSIQTLLGTGDMHREAIAAKILGDAA